jgi:uncharacterized protein YkwD
MTRILFAGVIFFTPLLTGFTTLDTRWADVKYQAANTASAVTYLSDEEKKVVFYLNLARMFPSRFADLYLTGDAGKAPTEGNELSLYQGLKKMKPLPPLKPEQQLSVTAKCWATEAGNSGVIGHDRKICKEEYWAECCHYGSSGGLHVVLNLLIDNGVESLGHRHICLGDYTTIGVSIQPHKTWGTNAVLDFK